MKEEKFVVEQRRLNIYEQLKQNEHIKPNELAELFNVSVITIRRDLQVLEDQKKIRRFYGGVSVLKDEVSLMKRPDLSQQTHADRDAVSRYAATLVEDGDTIFINTSYTALKMITFIENKNVTVITNNGRAINLDHSPLVAVVLTGGELRANKGAMTGEFAINNLERVTAKKCFIGCSGLSVENGMTTEILSEVNINQIMMRRVTGPCYILADHSKLGQNSSFVSIPLNQIKNIITDSNAEIDLIASFEKEGIKVFQG